MLKLKRQCSKNKLSQIRSSSGSELQEELCAQVGTDDGVSLTHVTLKAPLSLSLTLPSCGNGLFNELDAIALLQEAAACFLQTLRIIDYRANKLLLSC